MVPGARLILPTGPIVAQFRTQGVDKNRGQIGCARSIKGED